MSGLTCSRRHKQTLETLTSWSSRQQRVLKQEKGLIQKYKNTNRQNYKQTKRQTDKQTKIQTGKQTLTGGDILVKKTTKGFQTGKGFKNTKIQTDKKAN